MRTIFFGAACAALAAVSVPFPSAAAGQAQPVAEKAVLANEAYVGEDVMIPMRDGVKLHAEVWRPKDASGPLPILIERWPYGFPLERTKANLAKGGWYGELAADKFIFVFQDIRGRFRSEGEYVTLRPPRTDPAGTDESTDTYDTIEWLVRQVPGNNGKVGILGVSYGGWTSAVATIDPHPALKAVSSQAPPDDQWLGDDFHHNGAFRLDYAWSWLSLMETDGRTLKRFDFGGQSAYDWYLKQADVATLDRQHLGRSMPYWQLFSQHPDYDGFWRRSRTSNMMPAKPTVPNLIVAGWWDQEDFYGPLTIYARQKAGDSENRNHLVIGPWNHGGWRGEGSTYGPYRFGSATGNWYQRQVELPWFRYWLKGEGVLDQPRALIFQSGSNQWQRFKSWPPKEGVTTRNLYFRSNGRLSFDAPKAGEGDADSFVSDPANPVPYRDRATVPMMAKGTTWKEWLADDQAPFAERKDVLVWQTEPLDRDVALSGAVVAKLFASTTGRDADWVVKLLDIHPDDAATPAELRGRQRMIANEVFRGRYRKSFEKPEPLTPRAVLDYKIDLHSASHVFRKGHRIAVQVQSSWFPLIDRNPQTWVPNIYRAKPGDYVAQTHKIYRSIRYPSSIEVAIAD